MAGDIGCTVKLKGTRTNDTLAAPSAPVTVEPIVFPEPRYRAAVKAKEQGDEEKSWARCSTTPNSRTRRFWSNTPRS